MVFLTPAESSRFESCLHYEKEIAKRSHGKQVSLHYLSHEKYNGKKLLPAIVKSDASATYEQFPHSLWSLMPSPSAFFKILFEHTQIC